MVQRHRDNDLDRYYLEFRFKYLESYLILASRMYVCDVIFNMYRYRLSVELAVYFY